ncbi:class D sortase [Zhenhengia yiwuensis]|uniref:class D sortase n=1 Tax=Zhenhengia yiwuensis TaxID=2763666 RepID=UPI002A74FE44|nr:class D sortase [Zhenhengia yiwuensis]MDY3367447.1 class D sortase [Zhenhengia yiwuensis]
MKKILSKVLIIVGILLLLLPSVGNLYTKYQQDRMYQAYLDNLTQIETSMQTLNEALVSEEELAEEQPALAAQTPNGLDVMGIVSIPKIGVDLMFVEGVSKQALKFAVGHMPGTAMPGEVGNCAIAGHRSYTFGEYFNRLDEVEIGDEIQIAIGKENYTYKVYESFLVEPSEVWVTEPIEDKKVVTLITCHPVVKATHRLIVRGELVE